METKALICRFCSQDHVLPLEKFCDRSDLEIKYDMLQKRVDELEAENKKLREALSNFSNPDFYWHRKQVDSGNGWITLGKSKTHEELAEYAKKALGEVGE